MRSENLHRLIQNLSKAQKDVLKNAFSKGRRKPDHVVLYERYVRNKTFKDETIRGVEFRDSRKFNRYREILVDKIVQHLAEAESNKTRESLIKVAVQLGAAKVAIREISDEIREAISQGRHIHAYSLLKEVETLKSDFDTNLKLRIEVTSGEILKRVLQLQEWEKLFEKGKSAFHKTRFEAAKIANEIKDCSDQISPFDSLDEYWKKRLEVIYLAIVQNKAAFTEERISLAEMVLAESPPIRLMISGTSGTAGKIAASQP